MYKHEKKFIIYLFVINAHFLYVTGNLMQDVAIEIRFELFENDIIS